MMASALYPHPHPASPSSLRWLLASEDWPGYWAGLQAEVSVSCELIWLGAPSRPAAALAAYGGAKGAIPGQGGCCMCAHTCAWVGVSV